MCVKNQRPCRLALAILSTITCFLSIAILALTLRFSNSDFYSQPGEVKDYLNTSFYVLVSFAAVALAVSILGMMAAKCGDWVMCTVIFGVFSFVVMIVFLIFGSSLTLFSSASEDQIIKFCDGGYSDSKLGYFYTMAMDIDAQYDKVNSMMCTQSTCPCPYDKRAPWTQTVTGWDEQQINELYDRSYNINSPNYLYFSQLAGETTYNSFLECLDARNTNAISDTTKSVMQWMEISYKCSGVCKTALFYVTLDLSNGRPMETCSMSLKDGVKNNLTYMGIVVLITGIVMFFAFIVQYCLWKKKK